MDHLDLPSPADARDVLGGTGGFARALERWAADVAVDEAARQRARQHWLRTQAEEEASLAGTLLDLAERGSAVAVEAAGHRVRGRIVGVGADFAALRSEADQDTLVRTAAIELLRAAPGAAVTGDRTAVVDIGLAGVLGPLAAERPEVLVRTSSGSVVRGELRRAGTDVVQLRVDGDPPSPAWVPIDALAVVVLHP